MSTISFVSGFMERRAPIVRYYRLGLCIKQTKAFQHLEPKVRPELLVTKIVSLSRK